MNEIKNYCINNPYIGVHYRNTDRKTNIDKHIQKIKNQLKKNTHINTLFIATDDYKSLHIFRSKFPNINIISYCKIKDDNIANIHYLNNKTLKKYNLTKKQQVLDVLIDSYLLYKSNIFIGSYITGMSKYINLIRRTNTTNIFNE
tara:strand:+ start:392 stop:826 length:435 start_codon:yes stop_codon:yes gene_type:complete